MDLLTLQSREYVVLVDYYSDSIEVQEISDTTSPTTLKQFLKEQFGRHGIPDVSVSDNGPQLRSHEFRRLAEEWEFKYATSSPHHHRSSDKAESAVKVTKNLFKKALRDGRDPWLALSRRTKICPRVVQDVEDKIELKRQKANSYHNRSAHPLLPLEVGQEVRLRTPSKRKNLATRNSGQTAIRQILSSKDWKQTYLSK